MKHQMKTPHQGIRKTNELTKEKANSGIVLSYIQPDPTGKKGRAQYYGFRPRGGNDIA